jgi:hypothetical protein
MIDGKHPLRLGIGFLLGAMGGYCVSRLVNDVGEFVELLCPIKPHIMWDIVVVSALTLLRRVLKTLRNASGLVVICCPRQA